MCSSAKTCGGNQQSGKLGSRCHPLCVDTAGGSHTSARPLNIFILCPSKGFFVQLDGAATRWHHEITRLHVVIVKNMDQDTNIEIFGGEWDQQRHNKPVIGVFRWVNFSLRTLLLPSFLHAAAGFAPQKAEISQWNKRVELLMHSFAFTHRNKSPKTLPLRRPKNLFNNEIDYRVLKACLSKYGGSGLTNDKSKFSPAACANLKRLY